MVAETRARRRATYDEQQTTSSSSSYLQTSSTSYPQQTPYYPQYTSSSVPSSLESSSSLSSFDSGVQQNHQPNMLTPASQNATYASAPLPSPSASSGRQINGYFGSFSQQQQQMQMQQTNPTSTSSTHHAPQHQARIPPSGQTGQYHAGQRGSDGGGGGGAPATAPFLKDFNLVAEAAKRAQMACLTRDLDDFGM